MPPLLTSQKNALFDCIEQSTLSVYNFGLTDNISSSGISTKIDYKGSTFFFHLRSTLGKWHVKYSPGEFGNVVQGVVGRWSDVIERFKNWVSYVFGEVAGEDKWARLEQEIKQINFTIPTDSERFTAAEFEALKVTMIVFKTEIKQLNLSQEHFSLIDRKLDYLTEMAHKSSKFDWKGLLVSTIVSIIIQLGVTKENAKALWDVLKRVFTNYFLN